MAWDQKVPFTKQGGLVIYTRNGRCDTVAGGSYDRRESVVWIGNHEFEATLKYKSFTRGRSAARFVWINTTTGAHYEMFMASMSSMILAGATIKDGCVTGHWTFEKRGTNYGIKMVT